MFVKPTVAAVITAVVLVSLTGSHAAPSTSPLHLTKRASSDSAMYTASVELLSSMLASHITLVCLCALTLYTCGMQLQCVSPPHPVRLSCLIVFLFHQSGSEHNLNTPQFQWAPPLCALSSLRDMMTTEEAESSSAALQLVDHTLTEACEWVRPTSTHF